MTEPKYMLVICWCDEDEAFIAEAPELPGCAADGRTRREALAKRGDRHPRVDSDREGVEATNSATER